MEAVVVIRREKNKVGAYSILVSARRRGHGSDCMTSDLAVSANPHTGGRLSPMTTSVTGPVRGNVVDPRLSRSARLLWLTMKGAELVDRDVRSDRAAKRRQSLEAEFNRLTGGARQGVGLDEVLKASEVSELLSDGLLARSEVEGFVKEVAGEVGGVVDLQGFIRIHELMDELFDDDEEDETGDSSDGEEEEEEVTEAAAEPSTQISSSPSAGLPIIDVKVPEREFAKSSKNGIISFKSFLASEDVKEYVDEGLLTRAEAETLWREVAGEAMGGLDKGGFMQVWARMEGLFEDIEEEEEEEEEDMMIEDDDDEEEEEEGGAVVSEAAAAAAAPGSIKPQLLSLISSVEGVGLEEDEAVDKKVIELCNEMARDEVNNLASNEDLDLDVLEDAVIGDWELIYTTSRTMRFNQGLCGLGRSLPQAEFLSLSHSLTLNGFAYDMKYCEKLRTLGREVDVVVDAAWELKDVVSVMDGSVSLTLDISLQQIKYGPITEKLETGWKGVRVLNRCQVLYVDAELRVMKGQSADSFFVFQRTGDGSGATLVARPPSSS